MAKEAGIKLTLKSSGFTSGLRDVEQQTAAAGKRMGGGLKTALGDGLKGGMTALKGAMSTLKSTVMSVGSVGGAIGGVAGTVALVQGALKAESSYKNLAFQIKAGGGALVDWRDLQKDAQAQAVRTGISVEDIAASMGAVRDATGDTDFMRASIGAIATTARATGKPIGELASIAGGLGEKFGVTAKELPDTLADVVSLAAKGGVTFEEMAGGIDAIGSVAKSAGLEGRAGFGQLLAVLNVADNEGKNLRKNLSQVGSVLAKIGTKGAAADTFGKLGMKRTDATGDMQKNLAAVLKFTGGDKDKLTKGGFSDEQTSFLMEMAKTANAAGGLQAALAAAGKSSMTFGGIEAQAADRMKGAQAQVDQAMEKMKVAFSNPEFIKGLTSLMGRLPAAVDKIVKIAGYAADHPVAAVGAGAGLVLAKGTIEATLGSVVQAAMTKGGAAAAQPFAEGAAKGLAGGGASLFAQALGPLLAVAVAGAMGKAAIDIYFDQESKKRDAAEAGEMGANNVYLKGRAELRNGGALSADTAGQIPQAMQTVLSEIERLRDVDGQESHVADLEQILDGLKSLTEARAPAGWHAPTSLPGDGGFSFMSDNGGTAAAGGAPAKPAAPQQSPANAALLREMMAMGGKLGGELKVRITNPEAIRAPRKGTDGFS